MYARVGITTQTKKEALVLPSSAVVDLGGRRGIFQLQNDIAVFRTVQVGAEQGAVVEILSGLTEGDEVISTGAGALRDGDRVAVAGRTGRGRRGDGQTNAATDQGGGGRSTPGGAAGDPPAGGATEPSQGQGAAAGAAGSRSGREGYSGGRRGDGSGGTGNREGREGGRFGGEGSGRRGGNGTPPPPSGGVSQ
jgi:hypothetical protein